jgi:(p)ppGpp synthase/HD superfamily hydrolase
MDFSKIKRILSPNDVDNAIMLAEHHHRNQMYGIFPYMKHVHDVIDAFTEAYDLSDFDSNFEENEYELKIACALHDCIEDGHLSYNDIKKEFGKNVAEIVYAVTDELGRNRKERKQKTYKKIKDNVYARVVKLCDRLANIESSAYHRPDKLKMYKKEMLDFERAIRSSSELKIETYLWERIYETLDKAQ